DVGGTWYWNRYPGARCDVESMQYSYQFDDELQQTWDWSQRYSPQPEILAYAQHVAERFDLKRDIQFDTRVKAATYDEAAASWTVQGEAGDICVARHVVMATGCLSKPNWPEIPGFEDFGGPVYHTSIWPHEAVDFTGKRVAVIGTGSSAIQSIPHIAEQAKSLTIFQRTANYSIPAHNAALDPDRVAIVKANYSEIRARAKKNFPGLDGPFNASPAMEATEEERRAEYESRWREGGLTFMGAYGDLMFSQAANDSLANFVRDKIRDIVDDPKVAEKLCPKNIIGGKRLCVDTHYYQTYNRPNVSLVDVNEDPIIKLGTDSLSTANNHFAIDVLVIATGFDAMTGALTNVDIRGREGVLLSDLWRDGPSSYLGLAMADFPNLFTVTGPGSPSVFTNMLPTIEQHVDWIAQCIADMREGNYTTIEATPQAQAEWWDHVQEVAQMGLKSSTASWYLGANVSGKAQVFMPYYGGFPAYCEKCEQVTANAYEGFARS
ncbi:MAG: NAD(P)/FAD-dependent oxidoreductase, partial [Chromatiales bacterium]|nr:NAD(P)/FAD-dependent oxidoreductase [Chromatiales bacterium]